MKPGATKIALVGATDSRMEAPYGDPDFEIWTMNDIILDVPDQFKHIDRLFDIHGEKHLQAYRDGEHWEYLKTLNIPIYMNWATPEIPTSISYPLEVLAEEFGDYYQGSLAYMLQMALWECVEPAPASIQDLMGPRWTLRASGAREIHYYGVRMEMGSAIGRQQRSCIEYYIGIADAIGVKRYIHPESYLMNTNKLDPRYGIYTEAEYRDGPDWTPGGGSGHDPLWFAKAENPGKSILRTVEAWTQDRRPPKGDT